MKLNAAAELACVSMGKGLPRHTVARTHTNYSEASFQVVLRLSMGQLFTPRPSLTYIPPKAGPDKTVTVTQSTESPLRGMRSFSFFSINLHFTRALFH